MLTSHWSHSGSDCLLSECCEMWCHWTCLVRHHTLFHVLLSYLILSYLIWSYLRQYTSNNTADTRSPSVSFSSSPQDSDIKICKYILLCIVCLSIVHVHNCYLFVRLFWGYTWHVWICCAFSRLHFECQILVWSHFVWNTIFFWSSHLFFLFVFILVFLSFFCWWVHSGVMCWFYRQRKRERTKEMDVLRTDHQGEREREGGMSILFLFFCGKGGTKHSENI